MNTKMDHPRESTRNNNTYEYRKYEGSRICKCNVLYFGLSFHPMK